MESLVILAILAVIPLVRFVFNEMEARRTAAFFRQSIYPSIKREGKVLSPNLLRSFGVEDAENEAEWNRIEGDERRRIEQEH